MPVYFVWPAESFNSKGNSFGAGDVISPCLLPLTLCVLELVLLPQPESAWLCASQKGNRDGGGAGTEGRVGGFAWQAEHLRLPSLACCSTPINVLVSLMMSEVTSSKHSWGENSA